MKMRETLVTETQVNNHFGSSDRRGKEKKDQDQLHGGKEKREKKQRGLAAEKDSDPEPTTKVIKQDPPC